jgi:hypothetical protein
MYKFSVFIMLFLFWGESIRAQQKAFPEKISNLKISNSFKTKAHTAFNATKDPCWEGNGPVSKDCSDLKDPWENEPKLPQNPPADTTSRIMAFYHFEKSAADGVGGNEFPSKWVKEAWLRHPGFSLNAMRGRMDYYSLKIGD